MGNVLSPMQFKLYAKSLGQIIQRFGTGFHKYADAFKVCISGDVIRGPEITACLLWLNS